MKKFVFAVAPLLMILLFTQCQQDEVLPEDMLIAEIENAQNKVNIDPADLPGPARTTIEEEYFETYIETAAHVPGKGYEVVMGSEDRLYFRENGLRLRGGPDGLRHPGPCGRGIPVRVDDLPEAITDYVSTNYPDAEILRAKQFPRGYVLLISGRRILVFNNSFDFVAITRAFYFCDVIGHPIDIANLPAAITNYVSDNYPEGEIVKAYGVRGRIVVGVLVPDGRLVLVFDAQGNFLFARG